MSNELLLVSAKKGVNNDKAIQDHFRDLEDTCITFRSIQYPCVINSDVAALANKKRRVRPPFLNAVFHDKTDTRFTFRFYYTYLN